MPELPSKIRRTSIDILYTDGASQHITINGNHEFARRLRNDHPELSGILPRAGVETERLAFEFAEIPGDQIREEIYFTDAQVKTLEDTGQVLKAPAITPPDPIPPVVTAESVPGGWTVGQLVKIPARYNPPGAPYKKQDRVWRVSQIEVAGMARYPSYTYTVKSRGDKHSLVFMHNSVIYKSAVKVDQWPLRRGDFVQLRHYPDVGPYKVTGQANPGDLSRNTEGPRGKIWLRDGVPAVWIIDQYGEEGWSPERDLVAVEVNVNKKQTWTVKQDVES